MGALANATVLRADPEFQSWIETAISYQSRLVIMESANTPDHAIRLRMARDTAISAGVVLPLMVTAIATDPAVAIKGDTASEVSEQTVIDKIAEVWTAAAKLLYPNG